MIVFASALWLALNSPPLAEIEEFGTTQVFVFVPKREIIAVASDTFTYHHYKAPPWIDIAGNQEKIRADFPGSDVAVALVAYAGRVTFRRPANGANATTARIDCILDDFLDRGHAPNMDCGPSCVHAKANPEKSLVDNAKALQSVIAGCWADDDQSDAGEVVLSFPFIIKSEAKPFFYQIRVRPDDERQAPTDLDRRRSLTEMSSAQSIIPNGDDYLLRRVLYGADPWLLDPGNNQLTDGMQSRKRALTTCKSSRQLADCPFVGSSLPNAHELQTLIETAQQLINLRETMKTQLEQHKEVLQALDLTGGSDDLDEDRAKCLAYDLVYLELLLSEYFDAGTAWKLLDRGISTRTTKFAQGTAVYPPIQLWLMKSGTSQAKKQSFRPLSTSCPQPPFVGDADLARRLSLFFPASEESALRELHSNPQ